MEKEIFLTFDDGSNEYTLKILEILKNFGAKATFFVCGKNLEKFPEIAKKIKLNLIVLFYDCLQTFLILPKIFENLKKEGCVFKKF